MNNSVDKYIVKGRWYYQTRFIRLVSVPLALKLKNSKIMPEQIVIFGLLIGMVSAYFYSIGSYPAILFGSLLYMLAWFLDFLDGDLARITNKVSEKGEWLDSISGRILEMSIYLAVFWGLSRIYNPLKIWILGCITIALHHINLSVMTKESMLKLKFHRNNVTQSQHEDVLNKKKEIGLLKVILREFTKGPDINGYIIILGGITNKLIAALVCCLIYNTCYLLFRLVSASRYYFFKASLTRNEYAESNV